MRFKFEDHYFDIIDYTRPAERDYIILESLNQVKENNNYKSIQVITLTENEKIILVKYFLISREEDMRQMSELVIYQFRETMLLSH